MVAFDEVWARIEAHAGEDFSQVRGATFSYEVRGSSLVPSRTKWNIPRAHFEKAWQLVPLKNTAAVQHLQGPSYLYAILMDKRIRQLDW